MILFKSRAFPIKTLTFCIAQGDMLSFVTYNFLQQKFDVINCKSNSRQENFLSKCRLSWDNGIKSPAGFDNRSNDQELSFGVYYDDFQLSDPEEGEKIIDQKLLDFYTNKGTLIKL